MVSCCDLSRMWADFRGLRVAIVEQVRDGSTVRVRLLLSEGNHQFANVAMAGVRTPRVATKQGEPSEQWGEEVSRTCIILFFYAALTRYLRVGQVLYGVKAASTTSSSDASLPTTIHRNSIPSWFIKCSSSSNDIDRQWCVLRPSSLLRKRVVSHVRPTVVIHPVGNRNIAEHLVAAGLARVVDWHAGMLASSGGMEPLRAAEKAAKEKKLCLYANLSTLSLASKTDGHTAGGTSRNFDGTVIRVWSGDQLSIVDKGGKERRVQLSSTRAPKCVALGSTFADLVTLTLLLDNLILGRLIIPTKPGSS